jgi:hypothetical protein
MNVVLQGFHNPYTSTGILYATRSEYDSLKKALKSDRSGSNPYWNNTVPGATYPIRRNNQDIYMFIMGLPNG